MMSNRFKDYYKTLGVAQDAGADGIKKAFRKLARKFHPDVAVDVANAEERFKEINEAYEVLGDPEKRRQYDAMRADPAPAGQEWNRGGMPPDFEFEGTGFSDFFERYFGAGAESRHAGGSGGGRGGFGDSRRGHDIEGDLMVTLQEAMQGAMRTLSLRTVDPATGQPVVSEVHVRIPAGVREGQRLRVAGHGAPGPGGGKAGDLYLRVRLAADPDYRTRGHDLYRDLALAPWEAVLGTEIELRLPGGRTVGVKIPAGTQSGDHLRLKGYGLPGKHATGDLYVVVSIEVPTAVTPDERSLWQKLRDLSPFTPRES